VLTLVVTPSLLMIVTRSQDSKVTAWWQRLKARAGLGGKPAKTLADAAE
jgi:multidrug efflux pump